MAAIEVTARVAGAPAALAAAFRSDPGRWLPAPARPSGPRCWRVAVAAGPLTHEVGCSVGDPWVRGSRSTRHIGWEPTPAVEALVPPDRALPLLDGTLALVEADGAAHLSLLARSTPPAGLLGRLADGLGLHRVATRTAQRFCDDVAARLERAAADAAA